jgi:hypothetical protein
MLQLRKFTLEDKRKYKVSAIMIPSRKHRRAAITSTQTSSDLLPPSSPKAFAVFSKGETRACCALYMTYDKNEHFLIIFGSMTGFNVGCSFVKLSDLDVIGAANDRFETTQKLFDPMPLEESWKVGYHRVCVSADVLIRRGVKYYMIDVELDSFERPASANPIIDRLEDMITPQNFSNGSQASKVSNVTANTPR